MSTPRKAVSILALLALTAACRSVLAQSAPVDAFQPRTYTQTLTLQFKSPADAAKATVTAQPLPHGKVWAFSGRWDDNSPNNIPVAQAMADSNVKATFFINESRGDMKEAYAKKLQVGGCDIGGHTQTHRLLNALLPNEIYYEILANRVQREADADAPLKTFAFPGGVWQDKADPSARAFITQAVLRSGYTNCPYLEFALKNPDMPAGAMSTGHQVVPGDHQVDLPKFFKQVDSVVSQRDSRTKQTYMIHMGVHGRQTGAELEKLKEACRKYAGNPAWWYCTMNEYAAYAQQFRLTKITPAGGSGATRTFTIERPIAAELGRDVPLTIEVSGDIASAKGAGFEIARVETTSGVLLDVNHSAEQMTPTKIDAIDNLTNAATGEAKTDATLSAWLYCDTSAKQLKLTLKNTGKAALKSVRVTVRLPMLYENGVRLLEPMDLAPGKEQVINVPLGTEGSDPALPSGKLYFVAEIDYRATEPARLFASTLLPAAAGEPGLLHAARMAGPLTEDVDLSTLAASGKAGSELADIGPAVNQKWFASTAAERGTLSPTRVVMYRNDKAWKAIAGPLDNKPQNYLVAFDVTLSEASKLTFGTEAEIQGVLLNGEAVDAKSAQGKAGVNRVILKLQTRDGRAIWTSYPLYLNVKPETGTATFAAVTPSN